MPDRAETSGPGNFCSSPWPHLTTTLAKGLGVLGTAFTSVRPDHTPQKSHRQSNAQTYHQAVPGWISPGALSEYFEFPMSVRLCALTHTTNSTFLGLSRHFHFLSFQRKCRSLPDTTSGYRNAKVMGSKYPTTSRRNPQIVKFVLYRKCDFYFSCYSKRLLSTGY